MNLTSSGPGRVSLVGAGPGDPGLLTVRAAELLGSAEVLAYDALIAPAILARAHPRALRVYVGHRARDGARIYRLHPDVLAHARAGRHVVRLKQGDPFLFGRGGEEAEELAAAGIPFEVVPGVTAALGACAAAGIPLTHRALSSEVVFSTGHDGPRAPDGRGTVVLYMAARNLSANLAALVESGRSPATAAALILGATTPEQRVIVGTLEDLAARAPASAAGGPPGLVVVGDVVRVRERIGARRGR